jgi:hypothetical protein
MPLDTVVLVLSGERDVPLEDFAHAISRFYALVKALSAEAGRPDLEWVVDDLARGSTVAVARGLGDVQTVEKVVRLYGEVGASLQENQPIPHSQAVRSAAGKLRSIVGGRVESMRLETPEREAIVRPLRPKRSEEEPTLLLPVSPPPPLPGAIKPAPTAFGAVQGRVQTLTSRGGLRFTLYDILDDKAVSCYLVEGGEEIMRDAWGKLATVEGWVTRDPLTGRPLTVRQVAKVVVVYAESPGRWREAKAAVPWSPGDPLPEQVIRRLRDA